MSDAFSSPVLAIDGGGTRCRLVVVSGDARYEFEAGPSNVFSDFDVAVSNVKSGLEGIAGKTGMAFDTFCQLPAFVGLAGVVSPEIAARVQAALPLQNATIADDRLSALRGALGAGDGFVAHCGTGSFLGAQIFGTHRLIGGWGSKLGDEASGHWVGQQALSKTLLTVDETIAPTKLTRDLLKQLDGVVGILKFARDAEPGEVAGLAEMVVQAAREGDVVACNVMKAGADYLTNALAQLGWSKGMRICLTGGLGPEFAPFLPPDMQAVLSDPIASPLEGAIDLARKHAEQVA